MLSVVVDGLLVGAVYGLVALGLSVEFGVMRIINFAHGYLVMLAMFAAVYVDSTFHVGPYASWPVIAAVFFALGVGIYLGLLQPLLVRGAQAIVLALVTLGLAYIVQQGVTAAAGGQTRSVQTATSLMGWDVAGVHVSVSRFIAAGAALALFAIFGALLRWTSWGRSAVAMAQDRGAAEAVGINPTFTNATTFGAGSALAGVAGVLLTTYLPASPETGLTFTLVSFVVVVLGGLGSQVGALLAGLVIGVVSSLVGFYMSPGWQISSFLLIFVAILLLRPRGLLGKAGEFAGGEM